jgi:hypothetical protein
MLQQQDRRVRWLCQWLARGKGLLLHSVVVLSRAAAYRCQGVACGVWWCAPSCAVRCYCSCPDRQQQLLIASACAQRERQPAGNTAHEQREQHQQHSSVFLVLLSCRTCCRERCCGPWVFVGKRLPVSARMR